MPLTGYLKIPDIPGESKHSGHEDEIDVHGLRWGVARTTSASSGRGRVRSRSDMSPLLAIKYYDASSPYLALAVNRGQAFAEITLNVRKDSGDQPLDYLKITMTNVIISAYRMASNQDDPNDALIAEEVEIDFEQISILYTQQDDDGSAGAEHEVELRQ